MDVPPERISGPAQMEVRLVQHHGDAFVHMMDFLAMCRRMQICQKQFDDRSNLRKWKENNISHLPPHFKLVLDDALYCPLAFLETSMVDSVRLAALSAERFHEYQLYLRVGHYSFQLGQRICATLTFPPCVALDGGLGRKVRFITLAILFELRCRDRLGVRTLM